MRVLSLHRQRAPDHDTVFLVTCFMLQPKLSADATPTKFLRRLITAHSRGESVLVHHRGFGTHIGRWWWTCSPSPSFVSSPAATAL